MRRIAVLAVALVTTLGMVDRAHAGNSPHIQGNTSLTLTDGSVLHLISNFEADVDTDSGGNTTAHNEATLETEIAHPPGPCVSNPGTNQTPPGPPTCNYRIRGEATASVAKPSLMIALLLLQHGYANSDQITATLGFTVTITKGQSCPGGCGKQPSDVAVLGLLFAQSTAVDPNGAAALIQLFNQLGINMIPPGPPSVPGPQ